MKVDLVLVLYKKGELGGTGFATKTIRVPNKNFKITRGNLEKMIQERSSRMIQIGLLRKNERILDTGKKLAYARVLFWSPQVDSDVLDFLINTLCLKSTN